MYGIVVVSHGYLAKEAIRTASMIVGKIDVKIANVSLVEGVSPQSFIDAVAKTVEEVYDNGGVLILTDLFGGSTTNFLASQLKSKLRPELINRVVLISGFNLAMIISAITNDYADATVHSFIDTIIDDSKDNIRDLTQYLSLST